VGDEGSTYCGLEVLRKYWQLSGVDALDRLEKFAHVLTVSPVATYDTDRERERMESQLRLSDHNHDGSLAGQSPTFAVVLMYAKSCMRAYPSV
jgi:hypothetical protein